MLTTEISSRTNTNTIHMPNDNNNKLSIFSFHKVQAMISKAPSHEVKSNASQQDISDRSVSIFTRVKAMLTPSEMTKEKLKVLAVIMGAVLILVATNGLAIGALITIGILVKVGAFIALLLAVPVMLSSVVASAHVAIVFYLWGNPESDKEQNTAHILKNILSLATILDTSDANEPDIPILFQLTKEIQDLSFMSGSERYDKVREALVRYLKTHQQCHAPLLQQATEQDQNTLQAMVRELTNSKHLSLMQMEEYHALLEESTKTPEDVPNTKPFKTALAHHLLSDLSSLNTEMINASDAKRRLTGLKEDVITETIDLPNQIRIRENHYSIDNLIDKLHYTSRLCSLLNSCYSSSTLQLSQYQCNQLAQCDVIYKNLRTQLLDLCLRPDDKIKKIWAMRVITRQLNRTWIERYKNQPSSHNEHATNPLAPDNQCYITKKRFDETAPTVDHANNIIILDADNHLYDKTSILNWQKSHSALPEIMSPATSLSSHILDVLPLTTIINMEQFTIENLLPAALSLGFIPQQAEAT